MKKIIYVVIALLLVGCGTHNLRTYKPLVIKEKSMTVPAGSLYLKGTLKDVLRKNGWRLYVDTDTIGNEKETSKKVISKKQIKSRYQMFVSYQIRDICLDGTTSGWYDISIIDNDNEEEVMSLSGAGCESAIASTFEDWLKYGKIQDNYSEQTISK